MLRATLLSAVAALALTACDQSSAPSGSTTSTPSASSSDAPAAGAAEQTSALAALHLDASGAGGVTFATVDVVGADRVFKGVKLTGPDAEDDEALAIEEVRLINPRMDGDKPVFDGLVLSKLSLEGVEDEADATMTIGEIRLDGPNAATAALIAALFAGEDPEVGDLSTKATDYAFKAWTISDVAVSAVEDDGDFTIALGSLSLQDLAAGALGAFVIDGVSLDGVSDEGQPVKAKIDRIEINGLKAEFLDAFADLEEGDDEAVAAALASISGPGGMSDPFVKRYDNYVLAGLDFDVDGVKVSIPSAKGSVEETKDGLVQKDTFGPLNVAFDTSGQLGAQAAMSLSMLGYESLEFSIDSEYVADPAADRLYSKKYQIAMKDGFTLDADYDVAGVKGYLQETATLQSALFADGEDADFADFETSMMQAYDKLLINGMTLKLTDDSIVDKGFTLAAAMMGEEPAALREQAAVMLAMGGLGAPEGTQALVGETITALQSFLRDPGTLTIRVAPSEPVSVGALMAAQDDPAAVIEKIGYSIEATGK